MIRLEISVAGIVELDRAFDRFTEGVSDISEAWPEVRDTFFGIEQELFSSEGGTGANGSWAPLSPAYAAWKAKTYGGAPILHREGVLEASLTGPGAEVAMEPLSMKIASNVEYAKYHMTGTSRMPARKPIDLTDEQRRQLVRVVQDWLVKRNRELFGAPGYSGGGG